VILVLAATADELAGASAGVVCGVGPVEAAARAAAAIAAARPDAVLNVGIAGAAHFDGPAFAIGSEAVYCDADDPRWIDLRIPADPRLLDGAVRALPGAHVTPIGTTARVGGSRGTCEIEAMEGYAVLRAAALAGVPAVEVRVLANAIAELDRGQWRFAEAKAALREALPGLVEELDGA
jgi:nucleoside phosphorylase